MISARQGLEITRFDQNDGLLAKINSLQFIAGPSETLLAKLNSLQIIAGPSETYQADNLLWKGVHLQRRTMYRYGAEVNLLKDVVGDFFDTKSDFLAGATKLPTVLINQTRKTANFFLWRLAWSFHIHFNEISFWRRTTTRRLLRSVLTEWIMSTYQSPSMFQCLSLTF